MATPKELCYEKRGAVLVKNLKSRHFDAYYCANREEALKKALELIPEGATVGWGGAMSAQQIGLLDALNSGNYHALDRAKCQTSEEREQNMRDCLFADVFLTGANVGFMPAGSYLGSVIAGKSLRYLLIPIGAIIGFFIVKAEPAVYVLNHQVEELTDGAISARAMGISLSLGVAASVALAMVRVLTGLNILYFLIPGYAVAIGLSFFVPKIFTAIAFDSGGVASGPMTATFMLQLMIGTSSAVGGNVLTDAFGIVATVAMMPLISIQVVGFIYSRKSIADDNVTELYADDEIVELWEVSAS